MRVICLLSLLFFMVSVAKAGGCEYWNTLVDPKAPDVPEAEIYRAEKDQLTGIQCLLKLEGRKRRGVRFGSKPDVSQIVPEASIEINALYQISELFYGNTDFAEAVALVEDPPKLVGEYDAEEYNSSAAVKKSFASYRKWFKEVQKIGLEEARKRKMDPLTGSGVKWY